MDNILKGYSFLGELIFLLLIVIGVVWMIFWIINGKFGIWGG